MTMTSYAVDKLNAIAACPACHGELHFSKDDVACHDCGAHYPKLDAVPILMPNPKADPQYYRAELVSKHPYSHGSLDLIARHSNGVVLDLGAGGKDFCLPNVVQLDIFKFPFTDVVASADALPFKDGVFDAVVSQAVFEHLKYPDAVVAEIWRVCKPGAEIKIDTAFLQPEHGYPDHYFNATLSGLKHWFRDFELCWEGVEDYQHPMHSLSWFLGSYLDGLPADLRNLVHECKSGDLVEAIIRYGEGENIRPQIIQALSAIDATKRRELAAGVSVLVKKDSERRPNVGGGAQFSVLSLESRVADLTASLDALQPCYLEQQRMLAVKRAVVESVDQELYRLSIEHERAKNRLVEFHGHVETLQADKQLLSVEIEHLRSEVLAKQALVDELGGHIVILQNDRKTLDGEIETLRRELANQVAELHGHIQVYQRDKLVLEGEIQHLRDEVSGKERSLQDMHGHVTVFQRDKQLLEEEIDRLRNDVAHRSLCLDEQHQQLVLLNLRLVDTNKHAENLSAQNLMHISEIANLRGDVHALAVERDALAAERDALRALHAKVGRVVGYIPGLKRVLKFILRKTGLAKGVFDGR